MPFDYAQGLRSFDKLETCGLLVFWLVSLKLGAKADFTRLRRGYGEVIQLRHSFGITPNSFQTQFCIWPGGECHLEHNLIIQKNIMFQQ